MRACNSIDRMNVWLLAIPCSSRCFCRFREMIFCAQSAVALCLYVCELRLCCRTINRQTKGSQWGGRIQANSERTRLYAQTAALSLTRSISLLPNARSNTFTELHARITETHHHIYTRNREARAHTRECMLWLFSTMLSIKCNAHIQTHTSVRASKSFSVVQKLNYSDACMTSRVFRPL